MILTKGGFEASLSMRNLISGIIVGLVIGLVLGYAVAPTGADTSKLEQQIDQLEDQVKDLRDQLESKEEQVSNLQSQIFDLQLQIEELEELVPPLRKGEWNTIVTFTGSTEKTTELFHIPSDTWRINWTYTGWGSTLFGFTVYPEAKTIMCIETLMTMGPSQSDTTYIYEGPGNYYIKLTEVNAEEWELTIEAFIPG